MAFLTTQISDDVMLMLECETTGAFTKSDLEIRPNPLMAFLNSVDAMAKVSKAIADGVEPAMATTDTKMDVRFGIKVDGNGSVLISKEQTGCQFLVTLQFNG
jgi:hypothetical protein